MSIADNIFEVIQDLGRVVEHCTDHPLTRRFPTTIRPHLLENTPMEGIELAFWLYKRYNDSPVLRMEIRTESRPQMDVAALNEWVAQQTGTMPFATVRLIKWTNRKAALAVTHTLLVEHVTRGSMSEVLDGLLWVFGECYRKMEEMEPVTDAELAARSGAAPQRPTTDDKKTGVRPPESSDDEEDDSSDDEDNIESPQRFVAARRIAANDEADRVLDELESLVGLEPVKMLIAQLTAQQVVAQQRQAMGLKAVVPSPHLVFMGNPGTGKTTVARLIGQLYKSLGILKSGHVIEADRGSLVAAYLGQTAIKTRKVCEAAIDGVLFIDEAYSLAVDGRDYGAEAVETLLTFMESHRGEFVVVVAGYPEPMKEFLSMNQGLDSRFDMSLHFPDFNTAELMEIFMKLCKDNDYDITPEAELATYEFIDSWDRSEGFGNGREVRRFFNFIVGVHANDMAMRDEDEITKELLRTIQADHIPQVRATSSSGAGADNGPRGFDPNGYL